MRKIIIYVQLFAVAGLLYACGGNQREHIQDNVPPEQDIPLGDGTVPVDSLERDSLDTLDNMMPSPPLD